RTSTPSQRQTESAYDSVEGREGAGQVRHDRSGRHLAQPQPTMGSGRSAHRHGHGYQGKQGGHANASGAVDTKESGRLGSMLIRPPSVATPHLLGAPGKQSAAHAWLLPESSATVQSAGSPYPFGPEPTENRNNGSCRCLFPADCLVASPVVCATSPTIV